jgi:hypothetical protein
METFPETFTVNCNLSEHKNTRLTEYLRKYIYETMIGPYFSIPDNCGISLMEIPTGTIPSQYVFPISIVNEVQKELEKLGWKTHLGYGNTVLFVFTADKVPTIVNCTEM